MQNRVSELYELTKKFNTISGSISELSEKAFIEQYTYIKEEFNELAVTVGDIENDDYSTRVESLTLEPTLLAYALDDCLDILITTFGFLQKLENLGVDISQAGIDTAMNNLSKYPIEPAVAHETVERKRLDGIEIKAVFNEAANCYVIRNVATAKVVKPYNFVSNDLSKYITEEVKENYGRAN